MNRGKPAEVKLLPAYSLAEAARYLGSHPSTLRAWFRGRPYRAKGENRYAKAVLSPAQSAGEPLSFLDVVEAHVLLAIRKGYRIPLRRFRVAMEHLREIGGDLHFLAHREFCHDDRDLFLKPEEMLISLSERGQVVDRQIVAGGLKQLVYGSDGYADQFYPRLGQQLQKVIVLDARVNSGKPCLARLGVGTQVIAGRFAAGERIVDLAQAYGATRDEIEEALRWDEAMRRQERLAA